jgi:hypothetical protein
MRRQTLRISGNSRPKSVVMALAVQFPVKVPGSRVILRETERQMTRLMPRTLPDRLTLRGRHADRARAGMILAADRIANCHGSMASCSGQPCRGVYQVAVQPRSPHRTH